MLIAFLAFNVELLVGNDASGCAQHVRVHTYVTSVNECHLRIELLKMFKMLKDVVYIKMEMGRKISGK